MRLDLKRSRFIQAALERVGEVGDMGLVNNARMGAGYASQIDPARHESGPAHVRIVE